MKKPGPNHNAAGWGTALRSVSVEKGLFQNFEGFSHSVTECHSMTECQVIQMDCFDGLVSLRIPQYKVIGWKMIALAKFKNILFSHHFLA